MSVMGYCKQHKESEMVCESCIESDLKDALNQCYLLERELEVEQRRANRAEELLASCREISAQRAKELMGIKEKYGVR